MGNVPVGRRVMPDAPPSTGRYPVMGGGGAIGTSWVVIQLMAMRTVEGVRKPAVSLIFFHL